MANRKYATDEVKNMHTTKSLPFLSERSKEPANDTITRAGNSPPYSQGGDAVKASKPFTSGGWLHSLIAPLLLQKPPAIPIAIGATHLYKIHTRRLRSYIQ